MSDIPLSEQARESLERGQYEAVTHDGLLVHEMDKLHAGRIRALEERVEDAERNLATEGREHDAESCTCGSLCPWCEIERLREENETLRDEIDDLRNADPQWHESREYTGEDYENVRQNTPPEPENDATTR